MEVGSEKSGLLYLRKRRGKERRGRERRRPGFTGGSLRGGFQRSRDTREKVHGAGVERKETGDTPAGRENRDRSMP